MIIPPEKHQKQTPNKHPKLPPRNNSSTIMVQFIFWLSTLLKRF